jgi:hypothetical protein
MAAKLQPPLFTQVAEAISQSDPNPSEFNSPIFIQTTKVLFVNEKLSGGIILPPVPTAHSLIMLRPPIKETIALAEAYPKL